MGIRDVVRHRAWCGCAGVDSCSIFRFRYDTRYWPPWSSSEAVFGLLDILRIRWLASDDQKDADFVPYYSHARENEGRHHPPLLFPLGGHLVNAAATAKWLSWKSWS